MILSPPRQTYRQTYVLRLLAVLFFGLGAAMLGLVGYREHQPWALASAAALALLLVASWVIAAKIILTIHDEGIRRTSAFGVKEIEWRNVKEYRYQAVPQRGGGGLIGAAVIAAKKAKYGAAAVTNLYVTIISNDGTKIAINSFYKDAYECIGTILSAVHAQLRPAVDRQVRATGAMFGPLRLTARDVQYKSKTPIPLTEITRAEIRGTQLQIKRKNKMLAAVACRSQKVPNVLLMLDVMETLGAGAGELPMIDPLGHGRF